MVALGDTVYLYDQGNHIQVISQFDLALVSLTSPVGDFGVGDELELNALFLNAGKDTIEPDILIDVEILLNQTADTWGSDPDGSLLSIKVSVDPMQLLSGQSKQVKIPVTIPDTILPGSYYLSAHIINHPQSFDTIQTNNYQLGNALGITIPERFLTLNIEGDGAVLSEKPLYRIPHKQKLQLIPSPKIGYEFALWSGDIPSFKRGC